MSPKAEGGFVEVPRALAQGTFTNPTCRGLREHLITNFPHVMVFTYN